jgi:hypothetical protein
MLIKLITNSQRTIQRFVHEHPKLPELMARDVLRELVEGLVAVRNMAAATEVCFWVRGGPEDLKQLRDEMYRCSLPVEDPQHLEFPHVQERRLDLKVILECQKDTLQSMGIELG